MKMITSFDQFEQLDIRVGTIVEASNFEKARIPAYKLVIDFGGELGCLKSSAQITELYKVEKLVGSQVVSIVNFKPKQIADFMSECLVLGIYTESGVVLLRPERPCENGSKIG